MSGGAVNGTERHIVSAPAAVGAGQIRLLKRSAQEQIFKLMPTEIFLKQYSPAPFWLRKWCSYWCSMFVLEISTPAGLKIPSQAVDMTPRVLKQSRPDLLKHRFTM